MCLSYFTDNLEMHWWSAKGGYAQVPVSHKRFAYYVVHLLVCSYLLLGVRMIEYLASRGSTY